MLNKILLGAILLVVATMLLAAAIAWLAPFLAIGAVIWIGGKLMVGSVPVDNTSTITTVANPRSPMQDL